MKKITLLLIVTICQIFQAIHAQKVNIGEKCPNIKLTTVINHSRHEVNLLTEFNNKPLIIDFWFIRCPPCLETIVKLDSLQQEFKNQFNILLATSETKENIDSYFSKHQKFKDNKQPIVYSAHQKSDLKKLFPHYSEPHEVWIDKNGIVQAITSHDYLTPENIKKFLHGDTLNLPEKKDLYEGKYVSGQALLITDEERNQGKRKLYYTWMGAADPQQPSVTVTSIDRQKKETKIICQNGDIAGLYQTAYSMFRSKDQVKSFGAIRTISNAKDSLRFESNFKTFKNIFCYEIFLRDTSETKIKERMQEDLDNFFGIKSSIEQKDVPCFVLTKLKKDKKEDFKTKEKSGGYINNGDDSISFKNTSIYVISQQKLYNNLPYGVVNETGYEGNVDLIIPKTDDIQQLKKALNHYGLDINLETRSETFVVLQNKQE